MLKPSLSVVRNALIALFFFMAVVFIRPGVSTAGFILEDFLFDVSTTVEACSEDLANCLDDCVSECGGDIVCLQFCSEDCAAFYGECVEEGTPSTP